MKIMKEMTITNDTFKDMAQSYRDLLFLLNKAENIIEMELINELCEKNGYRRITEAAISNLNELIKNSNVYNKELTKYYENELFLKSTYNFSYLESFPAYRQQAINGLRVLNERLLKTIGEDKILIQEFINSELNAINKILLIVRTVLTNSSVNTPFTNYIEIDSQEILIPIDELMVTLFNSKE
ncbi:hypothetical protein R84B8_02514 [Treponema sp. R8-4-B8]